MTHAKLPLTLADQVAKDLAEVGANPELVRVLASIAGAGRRIADQIMRAGILDQPGYTGEINIQDEDVRALDVISNEIMADVLGAQDAVAAMVSEEMADILVFEGH